MTTGKDLVGLFAADGFLVLDPTCWSVKSNVATLPRPLVNQREIKKYFINTTNEYNENCYYILYNHPPPMCNNKDIYEEKACDFMNEADCEESLDQDGLDYTDVEKKHYGEEE